MTAQPSHWSVIVPVAASTTSDMAEIVMVVGAPGAPYPGSIGIGLGK